jgi:AAA+ ATPase superfamily predicted ATPase
MNSSDNSDLIFTRPNQPKNSWQLLLWFIFEPKLLREYDEALNREQRKVILLKSYPLVILICTLVYLLSSAVIVILELPLLFPAQFKSELITAFSGQPTVLNSYIIYIQHSWLEFVITLAVGQTFGQAFGQAVGLAGGLAFGLALGLAFYIGYFHLLFYPFYLLYYGFKLNFTHSPYHYDAVIWLPIWRAKQRFCRLALQDPQTAQKFVNSLRQYRPLQAKLADYISHAANAGRWLQQPLAVEKTLNAAIIENESLKPSKLWTTQLSNLKQQLESYYNQSQITLKKNQFQQFLSDLEQFKTLTLAEHKNWKGYYLQAIKKWQQLGREEFAKLEIQTLKDERITSNVYVAGEALNLAQNKSIFIKRHHLTEQFSRKVLTSQQMPMFLIQGQRRTGKTSLLNFLNYLLGSGFKVIKQDFQAPEITSIATWLDDLGLKISEALDLPQPGSFAAKNWQQNWGNLQTWLTEISAKNNYKLILAFDEYEWLHDKILSTNPKKAKNLLAAMRHFSQHQNKIVFLFVGSAFFSELKKPNWNEYFVQAKRFRIDYLSQSESIRLITEPVKALKYPDKISQQMYEITQGHPALLQELCERMVDIANKEGKKKMTQMDLDSVVNEMSHDRDHGPVSVFWTQFCNEEACKETVKQILKQQPITDLQHAYRLEEHRFIINNKGDWQLRVPLFEKWLQRFADRY